MIGAPAAIDATMAAQQSTGIFDFHFGCERPNDAEESKSTSFGIRSCRKMIKGLLLLRVYFAESNKPYFCFDLAPRLNHQYHPFWFVFFLVCSLLLRFFVSLSSTTPVLLLSGENKPVRTCPLDNVQTTVEETLRASDNDRRTGTNNGRRRISLYSDEPTGFVFHQQATGPESFVAGLPKVWTPNLWLCFGALWPTYRR